MRKGAKAAKSWAGPSKAAFDDGWGRLGALEMPPCASCGGLFLLETFSSFLYALEGGRGGGEMTAIDSICLCYPSELHYPLLCQFFFFDIFSLFRRFFEGPFLKVPFSPLKCPKKKTGNKYETQRWGGGAYLFVEQFVVKYFTLRALEGFQIQY